MVAITQLVLLLTFLSIFHTKVVFGLGVPAVEDRGLVTTLFALLDTIGNQPPPDILLTKNPSAECIAINQPGGHLCCDLTVNGGNLLIQELAKLAGYTLNPNAVNGIGCE
jgi:hypothetical protein